MKKCACILPLVGFLTSLCLRGDYVYPVGTFEQEGVTLVLVMYQKSPQHTELWQWDPASGEAQRALLSSFTPLGVTLLPNNAGFSFFDNGRLRVKLWQKRSSKAIDIFEPLYDLGPVQWQTETVCYFHAREREPFSIYRLDTSDGSPEKIVGHETYDCFYPCVHEDSLWYLQRPNDQRPNDQRSHDQRSHDQRSHETTCVMLRSCDREDGRMTSGRMTSGRMTSGLVTSCLYIHDKPLAFLSRVSDEEFLVIEHPPKVNLHTDKELHCICCRLYLHGDVWQLEKLFLFVIPLHFITLTSQTHLCESLYPLLPRMLGTHIYFVSQDVSGSLRPYRYSHEEGVQPVSVPATGVISDFFTPYVVNGALVYGGTVDSQDLYDGLQLPLVSL